VAIVNNVLDFVRKSPREFSRGLKVGEKFPSAAECSRKGAEDARHGIPAANWQTGTVPFISLLRATAENEIDRVHSALTIEDQKLLADEDAKRAEQKMLDEKVRVTQAELAERKRLLDERTRDLVGDDDEAALSRSAQRRSLTWYWYIPILFVMGVGEYFVTERAFQILFNERQLVAVSLTIAAAALTISYAHLLGVTFKRADSRRDPLPLWVPRAVFVVGVVVVLLIFLLSVVRAEGVAATIPKWVIVLLFFVLQLSLLLVAGVSSYFFESPEAAALRKAHRAYEKLDKQVTQLEGTQSRLSAEIAALPNMRARLPQVYAPLAAEVVSRYKTLAETYRETNLRDRPSQVNESLAALAVPDLPLPKWAQAA
jgi:hypothetical protein